MNAPAQVRPARERYIPIVTQLLPGCKGDELQTRCSLLLLRDNASKNAGRCSDDAVTILREISRLASTYALADIPLVELQDLRQRLALLTSVASGIEAFAYRLAYPDGGTNEGG